MRLAKKHGWFLLGLWFWTLFSGSLFGGTRLLVGYLKVAPQAGKEDLAALAWLKRHSQWDIQQISATDWPDRLPDVLWIHLTDSSQWQTLQTSKKLPGRLNEFRQHGGALLLTGYAALLPHRLGWETRAPAVHIRTIRDNWNFDKKGFQSYRGHPVFAGLFGGTFVFDGDQDQLVPLIGYFGQSYPEEGQVVAVEKSYITVHDTSRLVIEYGAPGKVLSIGGLVYFARTNRLAYRLEKFLENCLLYLAGSLTTPEPTYWRAHSGRPVPITPVPLPEVQAQALLLDQLPLSGLELSRSPATRNYFDVAGRRALIMGKEQGGIEEFWVHPFRLLRDLQVGLQAGEKFFWLDSLPARVQIRPEGLIRRYQTPLGELRELVYADLELPGGFLAYQVQWTTPALLIIRFRSDFRWMWPYNAGALGDLHYGFSTPGHILHLQDDSGDFYGLFGSPEPPVAYLAGPYESVRWDAQNRTFIGKPGTENQVYAALAYPIGKGGKSTFRFLMVGTDQGRAEAESTWQELLVQPRQRYQVLVNHYRTLLDSMLIVQSPDEEFNRLWKWALVGTDRFWVHTPQLGTALVAGYATTARGWDGGQKISGRPGYAWYFGRDSEWSSFAIDNYGDFPMVRQQLSFLQKFQDLNGKIFHEISTSGVVHYDAADATPLYIILAAHYVRASGDVAFIRRSWPHIKRAMDFLYSTDTDGDGLIENTNVGHGWVEGGRLWGAHTTFYLAGLWAQTLSDAAYLAYLVGQHDLGEQYDRDARQVRHQINEQYWNDSLKFYAYGKWADGHFEPEPTVLPAVVAYYELLPEDRMAWILDDYAANDFSSDWGVRILAASSPLFNPAGYHYGSVWPLFTGWTALAEFAYGNATQGFTHVLNNMLIKNHWALGFVEEVMHGAKYQPSGVCFHQCWSETNILHPGIHGMVGWRPDAPAGRADLFPRFPLHWDSLTVNNLRVGSTRLQYRMYREKAGTRFYLRRMAGPSITVRLAPQLPAGAHLQQVLVNGQPVPRPAKRKRGLLWPPVVIALDQEVEVFFQHEGGGGMLPVVPRPDPGEPSRGLRIVQEQYTAPGLLEVWLEGPGGEAASFRLRSFASRNPQIVQGPATIEADQHPTFYRLTVQFPRTNETFSRAKIKIRIQDGE